MKDTIIRVWNGELKFLGLCLYIPLGFLALIYKTLLLLREWAYKSGFIKTEAVPVYVISVGNITLGGTGKTPVVEKIALKLKEAGMNPGIITRGYKRKKGGIFPVDIKKDSAIDAGDEAFMLAKKTKVPVIVGSNKPEAIRMGIKDFNIDIALLDDAFQTRNIKKDMEILVVKGDNSGKKTALFPLGPFREPLKAIKKADVVLVNKGVLDKKMDEMIGDIPRFRIRYKPAYLYNIKNDLIAHYNILKGRNILAFSGLGDNESFFRLIEDIGGKIRYRISYPDHYCYDAGDIKGLSRYQNIDIIVTTEKDSVKIENLNLPDNLFFLGIDLEIEREDEFTEDILARIKKQILNL